MCQMKPHLIRRHVTLYGKDAKICKIVIGKRQAIQNSPMSIECYLTPEAVGHGSLDKLLHCVALLTQ